MVDLPVRDGHRPQIAAVFFTRASYAPFFDAGILRALSERRRAIPCAVRLLLPHARAPLLVRHEVRGSARAERANMGTIFRATLAVAAAAGVLAAGVMADAPKRKPQAQKPNAYLAAKTYAITHFNPAQTDAMPYAVPSGTFKVDLEKAPHLTQGPVNIATLASPSPRYMWAVSSQGATYVDVNGKNFAPLAQINAPGLKVITPDVHARALGTPFTSIEQVTEAVTKVYGLDWTRIANGVYSVVDRDNVLYYNTYEGEVFAFGLVDAKRPEAGIKVLRKLDMRSHLTESERIAGLSLTQDGRLIVLGTNSVAVVDREMKGPIQQVRFNAQETITNSLAVDDKDGVYVATDKRIYKLIWNGTGLSKDESHGAWSAPYDTGRQPPNVKIGTGTGSTPTLMGFGSDPDKLVVITDGADRMKLVAFWRDKIPADAQTIPGQSPRMAGKIQVTAGLAPAPEFLQSEQSVVVNGYGAFVVNNIGTKGAKDRLVDVLALGPVETPAHGVERFEWDPKENVFRSVWARSDVSSTSMVPSVSQPSNIVFTNGYDSQDGWLLTGLDWDSGKTTHRTVFGKANRGNGAYAMIQFMPDGDLLFNSVLGQTRVDLEKSRTK